MCAAVFILQQTKILFVFVWEAVHLCACSEFPNPEDGIIYSCNRSKVIFSESFDVRDKWAISKLLGLCVWCRSGPHNMSYSPALAVFHAHTCVCMCVCVCRMSFISFLLRTDRQIDTVVWRCHPLEEHCELYSSSKRHCIVYLPYFYWHFTFI